MNAKEPYVRLLPERSAAMAWISMRIQAAPKMPVKKKDLLHGLRCGLRVLGEEGVDLVDGAVHLKVDPHAQGLADQSQELDLVLRHQHFTLLCRMHRAPLHAHGDVVTNAIGWTSKVCRQEYSNLSSVRKVYRGMDT